MLSYVEVNPVIPGSEVNISKSFVVFQYKSKDPHKRFFLKSATTRLYDTEAKIICIVSKKGAQCIECHHKDI